MRSGPVPSINAPTVYHTKDALPNHEGFFPLVYEELRRLAASKLAREPVGHTLDATALVHEAYLKLGNNVVRFSFDYLDLPHHAPEFIPRNLPEDELSYDPRTLERELGTPDPVTFAGETISNLSAFISAWPVGPSRNWTKASAAASWGALLMIVIA